MRTTITLDPDVKAIIDNERQPGETVRQTINRLIRRSHVSPGTRPPLPLVPGELRMDISDVSETLARLEDETD
jgi:hypothetical protein